MANTRHPHCCVSKPRKRKSGSAKKRGKKEKDKEADASDDASASRGYRSRSSSISTDRKDVQVRPQLLRGVRPQWCVHRRRARSSGARKKKDGGDGANFRVICPARRV